MRSVLRVFYLSVILAASGASLASAQTINFNLLVIPASGNPQTVTNNSTVPECQLPISMWRHQIPSSQPIYWRFHGDHSRGQALETAGSTAITVTVPASVSFPTGLDPQKGKLSPSRSRTLRPRQPPSAHWFHSRIPNRAPEPPPRRVIQFLCYSKASRPPSHSTTSSSQQPIPRPMFFRLRPAAPFHSPPRKSIAPRQVDCRSTTSAVVLAPSLVSPLSPEDRSSSLQECL